ncbi:MAG: monofunctional biosynthetic peptidoglycan transglycosylase [Bacteroidales bacterium]|nr:monofunctional biosynthetic peptidoglycan transglycosylase [Bacteroidales bacterium]
MRKAKKNSKNSVVGKLAKILLYVVAVFFVFTIFITICYRWLNPPITPLMVIRKVTIDASINKKWVSIDHISPSLIDCVVAAEDNNYLVHRGFDFGAIEKAIDEKKTRGRVRGASTISQQTAKNVFLWQKQSWVRKGTEVYFTFLIEAFWSKERIMEVYLNVIEMGKGIYGAEAAAQSYFHRSAKQLTPNQSALIVAALPSPLKRNPAKPSEYLSSRAGNILALSHKIGQIKFDKESIEKAKHNAAKRELQSKNKKK